MMKPLVTGTYQGESVQVLEVNPAERTAVIVRYDSARTQLTVSTASLKNVVARQVW